MHHINGILTLREVRDGEDKQKY